MGIVKMILSLASRAGGALGVGELDDIEQGKRIQKSPLAAAVAGGYVRARTVITDWRGGRYFYLLPNSRPVQRVAGEDQAEQTESGEGRHGDTTCSS